MNNDNIRKWLAVAAGAALVAAMVKKANAKGVGDYFPRRDFIDAETLARSDDPAALGYLLGCVSDSLGCAETMGSGIGCEGTALGCALEGLGFNIFNSPTAIRQGFTGGRNSYDYGVHNAPQRGLTSGAGASGRDHVGEPTRAKPTGSLSLNYRIPMMEMYAAGRQPAILRQYSLRGARGMGDTDDGLGFSLHKLVKKIVAKPVQDIKKVTTKVKTEIKKATVAVKKDIAKVSKVAMKPLQRDFGNAFKAITKPLKHDFGSAFALLRTKDPLFKKIAPIKPVALESSASGITTYHDANGDTITEDQFNQQNAEADAFNQQIADMQANAPGEVQFDSSTGLYWAQDASGAWFQYDPTSKSWAPEQAPVVSDPYPGDTSASSSNASSTGDAQTAQPGDSLPAGVVYDPGTQLYWAQDDDGSWWYFDADSGVFVQEAAEPTASSPAAQANAYTPDTGAEQAYIDQIEAQEAGQGGSAYAGAQASQDSQAIVQDVNGMYWSQDPDRSWYWWSDDVQAWQPDVPVKQPVVVEQETGTGGGLFKWLNKWGLGGLGHLTSRETGNRMFVLRQLGDYVEALPLKADRDGKVYVNIGGGMGCLGCVDDIAGAEGLGFKLFGRTWGEVRSNVDTIAKDIASKVAPSAALYKYVKEKHPKVFKEYRREEHTATPYALIAGGTVLTVVSLGAGSAAGVAAIASGVAELGAQGYTDYAKHQANVQSERAQNAVDEATALESAGSSAVASNDTVPWFSADWWMGDVDPEQNSLLTVGEQT